MIFPNEARAGIARDELGFSDDRLHVVWNMPRRCELPMREKRPDEPLLLYYHGNISPFCCRAVIEAVRQFGGRVRLLIAGYEAPGAAGTSGGCCDMAAGPDSPVRYLGPIPRSDLLGVAARAHVGLAVVPGDTDDINIRHLTGASNKAFDYMAAGLALLVSDLPDWRAMFVAPGYALACDPADLASMKAALGWFIDHPEARGDMGARGRARIAADWNYDTAFRRVIASLIGAPDFADGVVRTEPDMPAHGSDSDGMTKAAPIRIAFLHTHPVQYAAPLYQHLNRSGKPALPRSISRIIRCGAAPIAVLDGASNGISTSSRATTRSSCAAPNGGASRSGSCRLLHRGFGTKSAPAVLPR